MISTTLLSVLWGTACAGLVWLTLYPLLYIALLPRKRRMRCGRD